MKKLFQTLVLVCLMQSLAAQAETVESLLGMNVNSKGISFQVSSGGCTSKASFQVIMLETSPKQLKLIRVKPDYCEAYVPFGTVVKFSYQELGLKRGDSFKIFNPSATYYVETF